MARGGNANVDNSKIQPTSESSRFREMLKRLQAGISEEKECLYFTHTHLGRINVSHWYYFAPGFVAIDGEDENKKYRFLVFPEELICAFPLEVAKKGRRKTRVGFKPDSHITMSPS